MERNSLTFLTSSRNGRFGGAACSPRSVGSSGLEEAAKEAEDVSVPRFAKVKLALVVTRQESAW